MIFHNEENGPSRRNIYVAAPLFNPSERNFNASLKKSLRPFFNVYLPQEDGGLMDDMIKHGTHPQVAARNVFDNDIRALQECDILLIVLDGRTVDEGAAFELGYAYAMGKPCYGLKSDIRQLLKYGDNPMIEVPLQHIFGSAGDLLLWAERTLENPYQPLPAIGPLGTTGESTT